MSPPDLTTVATPLATDHFAGDPSLAETHWSRFRPSNRTMASDGGASLVAPGVMIAGTGSQTSVSCGFMLAEAWTTPGGASNCSAASFMRRCAVVAGAL